jgi:hypothetical protein
MINTSNVNLIKQPVWTSRTFLAPRRQFRRRPCFIISRAFVLFYGRHPPAVPT